MPARTDTCGECGASQTFADGDWNDVQAPAIAAWERQHELDEHGGEAVSAWSLDPSPTTDPD